MKTILLQNRSAGGGSTITQQLAKNLFPRDTVRRQSALLRKGKARAGEIQGVDHGAQTRIQLHQRGDRRDVLNIVEYGSNAYGIKSAAHTFFNKTPDQLNLQEAAVLVGVVNAPTRYSPVRNYDNAMACRNLVLARMAEAGAITHAERDSLSALPITLNYRPVSHNDGQATYFREMLRQVMNARPPQAPQLLHRMGLRAGRQGVREQPDLRLVPQEHEGRRHALQHLQGRAENLYHDQLHDAAVRRGGDAQTIAHGHPAQDGRPVPFDQGALPEHVGRRTREDRTAGDALLRPLPRPQRGGAQRGRDRPHLPHALPHAGLHLPRRTRHDPSRRATRSSTTNASCAPDSSPSNRRRAASRPYVGGPNFRYFKYDMAKQGKRQIGSTIKPFVYTFAIDHLGLTPCTPVPNLPVTIDTSNGTPWSPKRGEQGGLRRRNAPPEMGLARSRNNYSAWIMKQAKQPEAVADFIHNMGIRSFIDPVYALCLGTSESSVFEMVSAYSTFANGGVYTDPIFVTRIEDRQGNLIATFIPESQDAVSERTAYTMLTMLQSVVTNGTAGRLKWQFDLGDAQLGGKTGTSQRNRDAWFMCVAPKLVAGAWVGGEDQSVHPTYGGEGSIMAPADRGRILLDRLQESGARHLQAGPVPPPRPRDGVRLRGGDAAVAVHGGGRGILSTDPAPDNIPQHDNPRPETRRRRSRGSTLQSLRAAQHGQFRDRTARCRTDAVAVGECNRPPRLRTGESDRRIRLYSRLEGTRSLPAHAGGDRLRRPPTVRDSASAGGSSSGSSPNAARRSAMRWSPASPRTTTRAAGSSNPSDSAACRISNRWGVNSAAGWTSSTTNCCSETPVFRRSGPKNPADGGKSRGFSYFCCGRSLFFDSPEAFNHFKEDRP